ncbi:hypothetical protein GCM10009837_76160 [Streptomyces durmitorensis]|uniref:Membrane protein YfcA n=1 Tax=Streptomyces durmitorensis TaxID=319947 RepID=A0ABY4PV31_9ACTN|nr:hypothetical protein [Streptomyces durmitorensis]UQT57728.1 hypothetical protein M4V62_22980 [Streptomyces durmitorensis]
MSDPRYSGYEGYEGYEGYGDYDPYRQEHPPAPEQQQPYAPEQQGYPPQQQYQYPQQQPYAQDSYTQQWEGQTWDTQVQPSPVADVTDTAYLPPQSYGQPLPSEPAVAHAEPGSLGRHAHRPMAGAEPEPEADSATYGPATTTGNPRVTDAQRARAEGRSPVIEPGIQPAALTAVLGLLLAGTAAVGQYALLVPLILLQAVTAAGWFRLNGMWPARQGIALAFMGGVVADIALLVTGKAHAPAAILGTLGVWVLLVLVLQLRSRASADERMYGLMATVVSAALAIIATGHLAASDDAVTVGGIAVAVAVIARALPLPTPASVVVALLAAAGAGIAVGGTTDFGSKGALLGLGVGVCALIGHRVASYDYPSRFVHMTAGVALPLAAAAPAVYVLGRAIG